MNFDSNVLFFYHVILSLLTHVSAKLTDYSSTKKCMHFV